ncbi:MAG TPA: adenylate cyclase [Firmicutes bacterium]|nr:adenylate cyclase [Bacillota bacterium]
MSTTIEIEFKNMLSETEYNQLLLSFSITPEQIWRQKNVYFDTLSSALKEQKAALRVRIKNNTYELTLKTHAAVGLLETNQMITQTDYENIINHNIFPQGPVFHTLRSISIDPTQLQVTTDLTTDRAEVDYDGGLLVFDKNYYHDIIDFELEYEVTDYDTGLKSFEAFLTQYNIKIRPAQNKIKRALTAKNA